MMAQTSPNLVTRELVPESQRMAVAERLFGIHFPLQMEPTVFGITEKMSKDYTGGYWDFYTLTGLRLGAGILQLLTFSSDRPHAPERPGTVPS